MFDFDDPVAAVSPFAGRPHTLDHIENGVPTIEVRAAALDPFLLKIGRFVAVAYLVGLVCAICALDPRVTDTDGFRALAFVSVPVAWFLITLYCLSCATVKFTPSRVAVRRSLLGGPWQVFNLAHPHRISLLAHDKAQKEKLANDYEKERAARSGTAVKPEVLYGDSFHICFEYFGQRHDIMTVYGRKEALRIVGRLQACLDINKARAGTGGSATRPDQQWTPSPGDLPR